MMTSLPMSSNAFLQEIELLGRRPYRRGGDAFRVLLAADGRWWLGVGQERVSMLLLPGRSYRASWLAILALQADAERPRFFWCWRRDQQPQLWRRFRVRSLLPS